MILTYENSIAFPFIGLVLPRYCRGVCPIGSHRIMATGWRGASASCV